MVDDTNRAQITLLGARSIGLVESQGLFVWFIKGAVGWKLRLFRKGWWHSSLMGRSCAVAPLRALAVLQAGELWFRYGVMGKKIECR